MSIKVSRAGRTIRLSLKGAITLGYGGGSLRRAVARALEAGVDRIEIDASGLRFLDAAGLGELVACRALAERAGAELMLVSVAGKARQLLRLTGLDRILLTGPIGSGTSSRFRWSVA